MLLAALALPMSYGAAQDAPAQGPNPPAAPGSNLPVPPASESPGLFQEIGRFFSGAKKSIDEINQNATATSKNIGDTAVDVGKTAADAMVKPLTARVVSGRERCAIAPNGAPDCVTAAQELCKRHGFATGKSVDFTSAEQCAPTVYLAGRDNAPACTTVTFISRAMCQ